MFSGCTHIIQHLDKLDRNSNTDQKKKSIDIYGIQFLSVMTITGMIAQMVVSQMVVGQNLHRLLPLSNSDEALPCRQLLYCRKNIAPSALQDFQEY